MKVAIVHDDLMRRGGAEQVAINLHKLFPDAPIFTLAYNESLTYPYFKDKDVRQSWYGKFVKNEKNLKRFFFPFGMLAMPSLNLKGFDLVVISSTYCGKYIKPDKNAIVINYCHNPFRLAWQPEEYKEYVQSKGLKKTVFDWVIKTLQHYDRSFANRTDYYITNAQIVKDRINKCYQPKVPIKIVNPPVSCDRFSISENFGDYFLVVCRLEFYKKVDIAIEAFNDLGLPLLVIGKGSKEEELKTMAKPNITFQKNISNEDLANIYKNCRALIFPQFEDYGITPLEAAACGKPVIAYGRGGILETMIPYKNENENWTSVFFGEQTKESLKEAIEKFLALQPDSQFIRSHAETFDEKIFANKISSQITEWLKLAKK